MSAAEDAPEPAPAEPAEEGGDPGDRDADKAAKQALWTLAAGSGIGLLVVAAYAMQAGGFADFLAVAGVCLMFSAACLLAGGALGFLFGIPRTLQHEGEKAPDGGAPEKGARAPEYRVNTNLEQISDWLTKILVGVGLTQLGQVPARVRDLAAYVAGGLGGSAGSEALVIGMLVYFTLVGFLFGYLWTRLVFLGALRQADRAALAIGRLKQKVQKLETQEQRDTRALELARTQLDPGQPAVPQARLDAAVAKASGTMRANIFYEAWRVRSESWSDPKTKPRMERTIPIFRALIANDADDNYHTNHGQLGFALKDKADVTPDDLREAKSELSRAIAIRKPWTVARRWLWYEFNRAWCTIRLDRAFGAGKASDADTKAEVLSDLAGAWTAHDIQRYIQTDPTIKRWMRLNRVTTARLAREGKKALREAGVEDT